MEVDDHIASYGNPLFFLFFLTLGSCIVHNAVEYTSVQQFPLLMENQRRNNPTLVVDYLSSF